MQSDSKKPHILLVLARGETIRNFMYTDTLSVLSERARISVLSAITDESILSRFRPQVERIIPLPEVPERSLVAEFRYLLHMAHIRWHWTEASKYHWEADYRRAQNPWKKIKVATLKTLARPLASRRALDILSPLEQGLTYRLRRTREFDRLFADLKPDLVFNGSHIHGPLADLPMRVAYRMGVPTVAFLFSWDNLTSRGRIFVPYTYYFAWTENIRRDFMELYPRVPSENVLVTGTPQFDFHFSPKFEWSREELCARMGLDPQRRFVLYTTGYARDFEDEYKIVEGVIRYLQEIPIEKRPQLLVRTYLKGNSAEMEALAARQIPDVIFPHVAWERKWLTPLYEDLFIYTNLLRHTALGINAASTVTLELMMFDKPVINLAFEPPDSHIPYFNRFSRHIEFEHYRPVTQSGAVMVAHSMDDLRQMIYRGLEHPEANRGARKRFLDWMFGSTLDGRSGRRVAERLLALAGVNLS